MKRILTVTIDVEPDCSTTWRYSDPLTFNGVSEGIKERLHPLFQKYDIVPTYLINNVVLEDKKSVDVFKKLPGQLELGTHLHPEFIEPQKKFSNYGGKKGEANCCSYEPEIEFQKIKNITELFNREFGYKPVSFRAGRFSAGTNTIQSLLKLGYKVDTSVTPGVRWDDRTREKPVDFRYASNQPYFASRESIITKGKTDLLEVPVSIVAKKLTAGQYIKFILNNKRLPFRRSRSVWLRPVFSDFAQLMYVIDELNKKNSDPNIVVYNMMFHNVEVMPGLSPYSKTEKDCENYLALLESFFLYCKEAEIQSNSLSKLYEIVRQN